MSDEFDIYVEYKKMFTGEVMSKFFITQDDQKIELNGAAAARLQQILAGKENVFVTKHENDYAAEMVAYCNSLDKQHHLYVTTY